MEGSPLHDETRTIGALSPPSQGGRLACGRLIGDRYEVVGFLGRGGYGSAYRVYDRDLKREAALKLLHKERETSADVARLRREVRVARDAASPRLVRIFDLGSSSEGPYLTMELVEGESLKERIRQGPLPLEESIRIAVQIFEGLEALHALSIIHRDIKPANILLSQAGEVKLADFGLARRLDREETQATLAGGLVGTLAYLSPEQVLGESAGPRSDLYSAGLVLHEMLAGCLPSEVEPSSELQPEMPGWLAAILQRLLAKRPEDRYPTAGAVVRDLLARRPPGMQPRLRRRLLWGSAGAIVLLGIAMVYLDRWRGNGHFSHLDARGRSEIVAIGTEGETLWTIENVETEAIYQWALARLEPGADPLLAIVIYPPERWTPEQTRTLSFLDPQTGKVVDTVELPSGADQFPGFADQFHPDIFFADDLNGDGIDEVVVTYIHSPEWPSFTVLFEPRINRSRLVFYGSGHQRIFGAEDVDGDGRRDLILAGIDNRIGWYNVAAAVRLDPWIDEGIKQREAAAASPDRITSQAQRALLLWYTLLPRSPLAEGTSSFRFDRNRKALIFRYQSGRTVELGYDGFRLDAPRSTSSSIRQAARTEAFRYFRESIRLSAAEAYDAAVAEIGRAVLQAEQAQDPLLLECLSRFQGKHLVAAGQVVEGERIFERLALRSENASDIAFDAGEALHLHGDLLKAARWYRRGIGRGGSMEAGKSKHEFLKGQVLALVELGRFDEAMEAVDLFTATYQAGADIEIYKEYARWRKGERPRLDRFKLKEQNIDLYHYWKLELERANGVDPAILLKGIDHELEYGSEVKAELLSLRGELLQELGRPKEAASALREALEIARVERSRNIVARAHFDLIAKRSARTTGM